MAQQVLWEVFNNIGANSESHYESRDKAVQYLLNSMNAVRLANPGSYWLLTEWQPAGAARMILLSSGLVLISDYSLIERSIADVLA